MSYKTCSVACSELEAGFQGGLGNRPPLRERGASSVTPAGSVGGDKVLSGHRGKCLLCLEKGTLEVGFEEKRTVPL